jgi:hypothetical protein
MRVNVKLIAALAAVGLTALPCVASAQAAPSDVPSYARPSYGSDEETVRGRVSAFDGAYSLQVRDDRGFIDTVQLHPGTIINPTGVRLAPGMSVTIHGVNRGSFLAANEIDTPYVDYGAAYPAYPYPYAYAYPYPVYAYPYPASSFSLGIDFGRHGWR